MRHVTIDKVFLGLLIFIIISLPIMISAYDGFNSRRQAPLDAKIFTLTGSVEYGWLIGSVPALKMLALELTDASAQKAIIEVNQGDRVVIRLTSNDVVHGFSLKDYAIFVNEGIEPGRPVEVTFVADRVGEFTFSCNAICGQNHETMQGILRVRA